VAAVVAATEEVIGAGAVVVVVAAATEEVIGAAAAAATEEVIEAGAETIVVIGAGAVETEVVLIGAVVAVASGAVGTQKVSGAAGVEVGEAEVEAVPIIISLIPRSSTITTSNTKMGKTTTTSSSSQLWLLLRSDLNDSLEADISRHTLFYSTRPKEGVSNLFRNRKEGFRVQLLFCQSTRVAVLFLFSCQSYVSDHTLLPANPIFICSTATYQRALSLARSFCFFGNNYYLHSSRISVMSIPIARPLRLCCFFLYIL
jgi:hypothetical protein